MKIHEFIAVVGMGLATFAASPMHAQQPTPQGSAGVTQQQPAPTAPLRVMVGKSVLINTSDRLKRVSVTDPAIADALVVTPNQVLVQGRAPGEVSLLLWDENEHSRTFDLRVDVDVTSAAQEMQSIFPDEKINVSASRNAVVLSGHVSNKDAAERAGMIASAFSKNVVNVLSFGPVGAQEILLEVKFAEVNRAAVLQLGVNLFSTGAANTFGATSTQQFGPFSGSNVGALPPGITSSGTQVPGSNLATSGIRNPLLHQPGSFGMNDLLNVFLFRTDINLGAVVRALQQKNILQILAEPNLIAVNGKEASFLAGGEFPFPVVQGTGGQNAITIQFKEFGVRLRFTPVIMPNGNIHLQVNPEVSALDFANGLSISGFVVPALSTRRATTEFELKDGQSFIIAGLMDNRLTNNASKIPGLGNIPVLGTFFKSKNFNKSTDELMVLVTARRISPSDTLPTLQKFPEKFLDPNKFDNKPKGGQ
jgi:pilus assembly protein CpaC